MNVSSSVTRSAWLYQLALIVGGGLLVAAPLVIFLRANIYLNSASISSSISPLPTFPIDDGYIYSNYTHHAAEGRWFAYQDSGSETSGGITSLLWYLLLTAAYLLVHILAASPGVTGGLELAAYLLGATLLATSAALMFLLARLLFVPLLPPALTGLRPLALGLPPLLLLLLTPQATWAALSGLELPLSMALVLAALYTLLRDVIERRSPGIAAAIFAGLLPWARPELAAVGLLLVTVTILLALSGRCSWASARRYLLIVVALGAALPLIYLLGTGRPLPSSFYAKSGQLALFSPRFFQAAQQLIADGGWPFLALFAAAVLTGLLALLRARRVAPACGLVVAAAALIIHTLATSAATVWYGQMERYLLPVFPLALLLATALPVLLLNLILGGSYALQHSEPPPTPTEMSWQQGGPPPAPTEMGSASALKTQNSKLKTQLSYLVLAILIGGGLLLCREAATGYAIQVRNIADAHIAPAVWLTGHTAPDTLVATEPVGALRLFSQRPTLDLVGLTTPQMLGHYGDWDYTWRYLHAQNAAYLLYYPKQFKDQIVPPWVKPVARFSIPDNRIAGAGEIVLYRLDWTAYP
jgi:hypothetical protein